MKIRSKFKPELFFYMWLQWSRTQLNESGAKGALRGHQNQLLANHTFTVDIKKNKTHQEVALEAENEDRASGQVLPATLCGFSD